MKFEFDWMELKVVDCLMMFQASDIINDMLVYGRQKHSNIVATHSLVNMLRCFLIMEAACIP